MDNGMREAWWYLNKAKEILKNTPAIGNGCYDVVTIREVCGTAYFGVLKAINECLITQMQILKKPPPCSAEGYSQVLQEYVSIYNGKLTNMLNDIYDELRLASRHSRGSTHMTKTAKEILKTAEELIEKIGTLQMSLLKNFKEKNNG